jgi:membrane-bound lytic murein transglycosylase D
VRVSGPLDLRRVAEWTGTPVDTIQQLNPELRRWTTPVRGTAYELKVPEGTSSDLSKRLDQTPESERVTLNWHTVRSGETLLTISRKLRVSRADLAEANYLSTRSRVRPGQKLIIPRAPTTLMAAQPYRPTPPLESHPAVERASLVSTHETSAEPEVVRRTYKVRRGDTLASIALRFDTSVASIKSWNRLHTNRISAGQRLTVYIHRDD